jgi:hypothetical protein
MRLLLALALLLALGGCSDLYPLPPPGGSVTAPTVIGRPVHTVIFFIEPHSGDRIEFVSAEPVGPLGDTLVRFFFSPSSRRRSSAPMALISSARSSSRW